MPFESLARAWRRAAPPPEPTVLTAGSLDLVPTAPGHYEAWRETVLSCEAYLRAWQPTWPGDHLTRVAYDRRQALYERDRRRGTGAAFHLFEGGGLVGMIRLSSVQRGAAQSGEVGYWVAERARGRGVATAALEAVCSHAFGTLRLHRVEAACATRNAASLRVLAKARFEREGVARSYLELDGVRRDHVRLARLADD